MEKWQKLLSKQSTISNICRNLRKKDAKKFTILVDCIYFWWSSLKRKQCNYKSKDHDNWCFWWCIDCLYYIFLHYFNTLIFYKSTFICKHGKMEKWGFQSNKRVLESTGIISKLSNTFFSFRVIIPLYTEKNIELTNFFLTSQQNFSSPYKKFCKAKSNKKFLCWFKK